MGGTGGGASGGAVVVGGGITGLAAAYRLAQAGVPVLLVEASDRLAARSGRSGSAASSLRPGRTPSSPTGRLPRS